jgi:hypothetical protein
MMIYIYLVTLIIGYEDCACEAKLPREMTIDISLELTEAPKMPSRYVINMYAVLPAPDPDTFHVELLCPDGDDAAGFEISTNSVTELGLLISLQPTFRGHINHVFVLYVEGACQISPACTSVYKCVVGVLIRGSVIDSDTVTFARHLSIDARPFMPRSATSYFDNNVSNLIFNYDECIVTHTIYVRSVSCMSSLLIK